MSEASLPPWLQEQLAKYEQLRQTLQTVLAQKQQLEAELADTERAIQELKKAAPDAATYKIAGSILVKVPKDTLLKEMEEKKELRLQANIQELQAKIQEMLKPKQEQPQGSQG